MFPHLISYYQADLKYFLLNIAHRSHSGHVKMFFLYIEKISDNSACKILNNSYVFMFSYFILYPYKMAYF